MHDCCSAQAGLEKLFGSRFGRWSAQREARAYREKGLSDRLAPLVDFVSDQGIDGATVLDIGFGVGALHFELLKRNAAHATGLEVVAGYKNLAGDLADDLGYGDAVDYRLANFAVAHDQVPDADIVVLDRSVCCYPDWEGLIAPASRKARRLLGLVLPVDRWFLHAGFGVANALFGLIRCEYRSYLHPRDQIESTINAAGLNRVFTARTGIWESMVYARAGAA